MLMGLGGLEGALTHHQYEEYISDGASMSGIKQQK